MRIVIAGCGRVGSDLALHLAEDGHDVSIIDERPEKLRALGSTFNGTTHVGLPIDVRELREVGIEQADAFVAVTNNDNVNVMSVELAKPAVSPFQALPHCSGRRREVKGSSASDRTRRSKTWDS